MEILEKLLNEAQKQFIKSGELFINHYNSDDEEYKSHYQFFKDMHVVMITDVFFEGNYCDSMIDVSPCLYKAKDIEQAWKVIKENVNEIINDIISEVQYDNDELEEDDLSFVVE